MESVLKLEERLIKTAIISVKEFLTTNEKLLIRLFSFGVFFLSVNTLSALTAPTAGSFLYDVYDIVVLKIVKGAPGFAAGVFAMVFAGYAFIQAKVFPAVGAGIGSALMFTGDKIVTSLGLMVM